jgi:predicted Zn-dependent protease
LRGGRWDEAEALAGELARVPGQERPAALVRALVAIVRDRRPEARRLLDAVLAARPDDPAAWVLRTWLAIDERDDAATARGLAQLRRQMPGRPDVAEAVGRLEAARGDLAAARATLEELLREAPQRAGAWEQLLRIDHAERRQDLAEEHVRRLLEVDPRSEVGNQFLASLQIARGRFVEAEGTLRRLIETRRSAGALNDLAWALREQGRARDAEPFADEAVRLDPASWAAQDTLGAVRMDLGRFGEARAALAEASRLSHGHPAVVQRMVELEEKVERARASR